MKILLVVHDFLPEYFSGTEICVFELGKELQKRGHKVLIFTTNPLGEGTYEVKINRYKGLDCYTLDKDVRHYCTFEQSYNDLGTIPFFEKTIDEFKPDIIHYHHLMFFSIEFPNIARERHIPQVYTLHDFWIQCLTHKRLINRRRVCYDFRSVDCARCILDEMIDQDFEGIVSPRKEILQLRNNFLKRVIFACSKKFYKRLVVLRNKEFKRLIRGIDLFVAPTPMLRDEFVKWGISKNKIKFIDDGIQECYFEGFEKKYPVMRKRLTFGFIGSIVASKGLDLVLDAFSEIKNENIRLMIWGKIKEDIYGAKINRAIIADKRISSLGTFPADEISEVFKKIDVLIVPSRWFENAPLVIKNSLLAKTPLIVTRLGGMTYLVKDGVNGFDFEINNVGELKDKMLRFISDPSLISAMAAKMKKPFTIGDNAKAVENIYRKLIKDKDER